MKCLITGGTGFVGQHLARQLAPEHHELVLIARGVSPVPPDLRRLSNVRFVQGNIIRPGPWSEAFRDGEVLIHCVGIKFERGEQTFKAVHCDGTAEVVEAARRAGVRKIILVSFLRARPGCACAHHETNWAAEETVRHSGLDYTLLKCGVIYGRGDHMLDHLSRCFLTLPCFAWVGFKDRGIRPVAIEDLVRVVRSSAVEGALSGRTVAVVGPGRLSFRDAMRRVASVVGRRPLMFPAPVWFHRLFAWCLERCMKVPLISLAQVRMMVEGVAEPAPFCESVPEPWTPKTQFTAEEIRKRLPAPGPFTRADFLHGAGHHPPESRPAHHHARVFFEMP